MVSLRESPDFSLLSAHASQLDDDVLALPSIRSLNNRRGAPRRTVNAPVYLGVVPRGCDRLPLNRLPVTVFKPLDAGWAVDLSTAGLAMLTDHPIEVGQRWWCRLDHVAARPTILPCRINACDPLETDVYRIRLRFLIEDPALEARLGFAPESSRLDAVA